MRFSQFLDNAPPLWGGALSKISPKINAPPTMGGAFSPKINAPPIVGGALSKFYTKVLADSLKCPPHWGGHYHRKFSAPPHYGGGHGIYDSTQHLFHQEISTSTTSLLLGPVYAFSPQLGGLGGKFPPISGARKVASPHLGGNKSQVVFQENPGF